MALSTEGINVKLGADIKSFESALGAAGQKFEAFGKRIRNVALGVAGILAPVTWMGANFDREMRFMTSVVTRAGEDWGRNFAMMTSRARELGATTEFTAKEVGEGMKFLAMAGFDTRKVYEAIPGTLDLATAGMMDLGQAADIATNILTQMGLETSELGRVSDVLAKVQSTANTNIQQVAEAFVYSGTMARMMGMEVEELAGFLGLLANNGIRASLAGTTLRQAMMKLADPSKDAQEIMDKYNLSIREADGSLRNFTEVILDLVDTGMDAPEAIKLLGARAGGLAALFNMTSNEIRTYIRELEKAEGTTKTLADAIRTSLWGSFKTLWSSMQEIGHIVFDTYKNDLKEAVDGITNLVRAVGKLISINKELITMQIHNVFEKLKNSIEFVFNILKANPDILEYGLLGYLLYGKKGLVLIGGGMALYEQFMKNFFPQSEMDKKVVALKKLQEEQENMLNRVTRLNTGLEKLNKQWEIYPNSQTKDRIKILRDEKERLQETMERNGVAIHSLKSRTSELDKENLNFIQTLNKLWEDYQKLMTTQGKVETETEKITDALYTQKMEMEAIMGMDVYWAEAAMKNSEDRTKKELEELEKQRKAQEKALDVIRDHYQSVYSDINKMTAEKYAFSIAQLDKEYKEHAKYVQDKKILDQGYLEKKQELDRALKLSSGTFFDGWKVGLQDMEKNQNSSAQVGLETFQAFTRSVGGLFRSFVDDVFNGELKSAEEYFKAFVMNILGIWVDLLAQMAAKDLGKSIVSGIGTIASGIGNLLGIGTPAAIGGAEMGALAGYDVAMAGLYHKGGVVGYASIPATIVNPEMFHNAPRLHEGLKSDEFPAILQQGETVLPKGTRPGTGGDTHIHYVVTKNTFMDQETFENTIRIISAATAMQVLPAALYADYQNIGITRSLIRKGR